MGDFAQEFLTRLDGKVSNETMKMVLKELRMFTSEYDIQKKETSLVLYEPSIPACSSISISDWNLCIDRGKKYNENTI